MRRLRIGFVGVGSMGQAAHLRNYASLVDECEVVALAEVRPQLAQRVAERYAVPKVYADHRELLKHEKLDGLVASQPFTRHGQLVPELLEAGVPVFTEKPIAGSLPVAERIVAAAERSGTTLMIGYHKLCDPATRWAHRKLNELKTSGQLGRLRYVRITMPPGDWIHNGFFDLLQSDEPAPALEHDPPDPDMNEEQRQAYIAFVNYYIHQVNLLRHLLGEGYRPTFADAAGVLLVAESDSGVTATIEMAPYQTSRGWDEQALACFEHGYVDLRLPSPLALNQSGSVELFADVPGEPEASHRDAPVLPADHAMRVQARTFLSVIRGEAEPPAGPQSALDDLRVARDYLRLHEQARGQTLASP